MTKGFTLFETIIAIALAVILGTVGMTSFRSLQRYTELDAAANQVVAVLREARDRAVSGETLSGYGVRFQADQYVRFVAPVYGTSTPTNVAYVLPPALEMYGISFGSDNAVLFSALDGTPDMEGSTSIRLIEDPSQYRVVQIFSTGAIGLGDITASGSGRIADTRHVHFNLGWSIQNSNTLTLRFQNPPNPDVVQNISMAPYMNADKSRFDWSGTISVGGEPQTLRIYTHTLTTSQTKLSVRRDRRLNTKALTISIDGQEIVSYTANGTSTVGFFGGTMEIQ